MNTFPRGSEWRKWDLHVHPPTTKLADGYVGESAERVWDEFCALIQNSDVAAIAITDYFSLDAFFLFKREFSLRYADSAKVFFPNLELRLNEAVNASAEVVDFHLIFRPDLTEECATEFLSELKTQLTGPSDKALSCAQLTTPLHFQTATVSRVDIESAIKATFGKKADWTENIVSVVAVNNSGIRADVGSQRKRNLSDQIDKFSNGFYGNPGNVQYFLDPNRLDADEQTIPKPTFAGSDAHSFSQLKDWLGKPAEAPNEKHVTWIKADLTFEGLIQTLIEPAERVRLQLPRPDQKQGYKVISKIRFPESETFPEEVLFNPGLNAIIGSRSSGKSALLAYVAHAIDPEYTIRQQVAAGADEASAGPGASLSWQDVDDIGRSVEWVSPTATTGRVIYIPQNSLFAISERPDEITAKIKPTVFRQDPSFEAEYERVTEEMRSINRTIRALLERWATLSATLGRISQEITEFGDQTAIGDRIQELKAAVEAATAQSSFEEGELEQYNALTTHLSTARKEKEEVERNINLLRKLGREEAAGVSFADALDLHVALTPDITAFPAALQPELDDIISAAQTRASEELAGRIASYFERAVAREDSLESAIEVLKSENASLLAKATANDELQRLEAELAQQQESLQAVDALRSEATSNYDDQQHVLERLTAEVNRREAALVELVRTFHERERSYEDMRFSLEAGYGKDAIDRLSGRFNRRRNMAFLDEDKELDLHKVLTNVEEFVKTVLKDPSLVRQGEDASAVVQEVLTEIPELRFVASLEGDRIGGFGKSSMTPGKQALFALTLILAESEESWPLLIDQPEDDLDSRSVCEVIVKDLVRRKRERQIIMASHDANLVIGADSEEVVVANRHGDDRPNESGRMFEYLSGSLEHTMTRREGPDVLGSQGVREHACEILDGGAAAFQKRRDKYRLA